MATLIFGLLFGCIGTSYFIYGKKQSKMVPLVSGIGLCMFPYLISGVVAMSIVGGVLTVIPLIIRA